MVDRRHRVGRPDLNIRDHTPNPIFGNRCTIICECGWSTKTYLRPDGAWHEYRQHKNTVRKPRPRNAGLSSSQENIDG